MNFKIADIRFYFKKGSELYPNAEVNELVFRIQPQPAIYWDILSKVPGSTDKLKSFHLELSLEDPSVRIPAPYTRLLFDVLRGDQNLFVRDDELEASWKIFTPLLHQIETEKVKPFPYQYGSPGPEEPLQNRLSQKYNLPLD